MALSATQLTRLRLLTGGVVSASEPDYLTDTQLQDEYTEAGDFDTTVVYVLRLRVGMTAALTDRSYNVEQTSEQLSQRHAHLVALLRAAEQSVGLSGSAFRTGTLDTDMDSE